MAASHHIAFDFGASSGRAMLGTLNNGKIHVEELHRFPNAPVRLSGHLHWDVPRLFQELKNGLALAQDRGIELQSAGVDAWGVDFGLLREGRLLENPFAYRDSRTEGMMEKAFRKVDRASMYRTTGIQFLPFNTIFQLLSMRETRNPMLDAADSLLFLPDLFHFLLTGERISEITIASTSQLLDAKKRSWDSSLFEALNLPQITESLVEPGTVLGSLTDEIGEETGAKGLRIIAPAGHDTACAVAAVPACGENWAYLSSGTWSLLGIEIPSPVLTEKAMNANFTNEAGIGKTTRFLRNSMGLWLLQRCMQEWSREKPLKYDQIFTMAEKAAPFRSLVDPDHESFLNPDSMPEALAAYCRDTGQPEPESVGAFARCILESLALKYRHILDLLGSITGSRPRMLHIVGGGSQNRLLNRFTADASGLPVMAGPSEATALGNVLIQAMACGEIASLAEVRSVVALSFRPETFEPGDKDPWDAAFEIMRSRFR